MPPTLSPFLSWPFCVSPVPPPMSPSRWLELVLAHEERGTDSEARLINIVETEAEGGAPRRTRRRSQGGSRGGTRGEPTNCYTALWCHSRPVTTRPRHLAGMVSARAGSRSLLRRVPSPSRRSPRLRAREGLPSLHACKRTFTPITRICIAPRTRVLSRPGQRYQKEMGRKRGRGRREEGPREVVEADEIKRRSVQRLACQTRIAMITRHDRKAPLEIKMFRAPCNRLSRAPYHRDHHPFRS